MGEGTQIDAKILVVDDEPANILLLERLLAREGFEQVHSATEGRRALQRVAELGPGLRLLNLHMVLANSATPNS